MGSLARLAMDDGWVPHPMTATRFGIFYQISGDVLDHYQAADGLPQVAGHAWIITHSHATAFASKALADLVHRRMILPAAQSIVKVTVEKREHSCGVLLHERVELRLSVLGLYEPSTIRVLVVMRRNVHAQNQKQPFLRRDCAGLLPNRRVPWLPAPLDSFLDILT